MDDLEVTKRCAEKMGLDIDGWTWKGDYLKGNRYQRYDPLHDDAQAMALVKKFDILLFKPDGKWQAVPAAEWNKGHPGMYVCDQRMTWGESADLNRAICECVANLPER